MTTHSTHRGHHIYTKDNKEWYYEDDNTPVWKNWTKRPCGFCKKPNTDKHHDACIADLAGVRNACCGHGNTDAAYIQFDTGECVYGQDAVDEFKKLKGT